MNRKKEWIRGKNERKIEWTLEIKKNRKEEKETKEKIIVKISNEKKDIGQRK